MPKKTNQAEAILTYFRTANIEAANLLFDLVSGEMKARRKAEGGEKPARKPRTTKASAPPSAAVAVQ